MRAGRELKKIKESDIKATLEDWLTIQQNRDLLWWCRVNSGSLLVSGRGDRKYRVRLAPEGTADILVIRRTKARGKTVPRVTWIETKAPGGRQTEIQREFQRLIEGYGCEYIVISNLSDLDQIFQGGME